MTVRRGLLAGAALLLGACASSAGVSDREVARLPVGQRTQLVSAQRSVDTAKSNVQAAEAARDDARQFRNIAANEVDAAKQRQKAINSSIELARRTRDDEALRSATADEAAGRNQLTVARAKLDYANRLVELREAQIDQAQAQQDVAQADIEVEKMKLVAANGGAIQDPEAIRRRRSDADQHLAEARQKVAALQGEAMSSKQAFDDRRHEFHTASAGVMAPAPKAPQPVPMPLGHQDVRGDVNDTPEAPSVRDAQQPQNNIAPAP